MVKEVHMLIVLIFFLLLTPSHLQQIGDFSDIERLDDFCVQEVPNAVMLDSINATSVIVSWSVPIVTSEDSSFNSYEIIYRPADSTSYKAEETEKMERSLMLTGLRSYTEYYVYIRGRCSESTVGQISQRANFTTLSDRPSAIVENLNVTVNYNGVSNLVRIAWDHIPDDAWNGGFEGYAIYIYHLPDRSFESATVLQVHYPQDETFRILPDGEYALRVFAFNSQQKQAADSATFSLFVVGPGAQNLLEYPFIYIIVPGIVFLVIIIVVTVVIFKKVHENRRRTVTYCKEIPNSKGYPNAIPLQERRSPSSSASPGVLSPSVIVTQASFTGRPLPLSPTGGPSPTRQPPPPQQQQQQRQQFLEQEPPPFSNNMASAFPPAPKLPHPGPLPQLSESSESSFVPIHRTMTNQSSGSVFSPTGQPFQHAQPRQRAKTLGEGMPSPYEVPEHNGSTLSRGDSNSVMRPASASAAQHRAVGPMPRGGNFPPPPAHSPPPLTHSSMELRAKMDSGEGVITSPPGQNTLPRSHQAMGGAKVGGLKHIRSEGHFPIFEPEEKRDERMVYIQPPLDSSMETSIHSMSSYGQNGVARRPSLDTATYPYPGGLATNGSVVDSEHFTNFAERTDQNVLPHGIPRAPPHNPAHHERDQSVRSNGRESLFSETSIEMSVTSSEREISPEWNHRGAKSDVGTHEASHSPEGRDVVSEVGTGFKQHPHRVFKQFSYQQPQSTSYQSPASIISSTTTSDFHK